MSDCLRENKRLRDALASIAYDFDSNSQVMREKAENALKVVPFKVDDQVKADDALLAVAKINKERADDLSKNFRSLVGFLRIWKTREAKMGNTKIASAIEILIDSYK